MEEKQQETADKKALRQEIPVYSEKYAVHGKVLDYGVVTKLVFSYDGKDIELGIHNNPLMNTDYAQIGQQILESYIENLSSKDRKVMLHNWYIEDHLSQRNGRYALAHGIVTGHTRLPDSIFCHTSKIRETYVNGEGELVIRTMNTEYHCPLNSCDWEKQDQYPDMIPDYNKIKSYPCILPLFYCNQESYPCILPLFYCNQYPDMIPDYNKIKVEYKDKTL